MKLIVDTHVLIWWVLDLPQLGAQALATLVDPVHEVLYSAASPWEMAIKIGQGRLNLDLLQALPAYATAGFRQLDIVPRHLSVLIGLERLHGDPFNRLIVAQALAEGAVVMTVDAAITRYPVRTIGCD